MSNRIFCSGLLGIAMLLLATTAPAHTTSESVVPNFSHTITNIPGKSLVAVEVLYPPGGASPPHSHAK